MNFKPQSYKMPDIGMQPFIDADEIWNYLLYTPSSPEIVQKVIEKSLAKNRLSLEEVAILINADDEKSIQAIKDGARTLKKYGIWQSHRTLCSVVCGQ